MNGILCVFRRELRGYFSTPLAYVFLVIFLALVSFQTFRAGFFQIRQASLGVFFQQLPLLLLLLVPAIAMRLWAEEKKSNSIELLFTLPITTTQAVLGKFFAALGVLTLALVLTFPLVITVYYLGSPDLGPIIGGYVGGFLLAGTFLAVGSFFSALTRNQVIAFILGIVFCGAFYYAGSPTALKWVSDIFGGGAGNLLEYFSFQLHFESLTRGVLGLGAVFFFLLVSGGLLWANAVLLENDR